MISFVILMQHANDMFDSENSTESFVLAHEAKSRKAIPLCEVDRWWRVFGFDSHHT